MYTDSIINEIWERVGINRNDNEIGGLPAEVYDYNITSEHPSLTTQNIYENASIHFNTEEFAEWLRICIKEQTKSTLNWIMSGINKHGYKDLISNRSVFEFRDPFEYTLFGESEIVCLITVLSKGVKVDLSKIKINILDGEGEMIVKTKATTHEGSVNYDNQIFEFEKISIKSGESVMIKLITQDARVNFADLAYVPAGLVVRGGIANKTDNSMQDAYRMNVISNSGLFGGGFHESPFEFIDISVNCIYDDYLRNSINTICQIVSIKTAMYLLLLIANNSNTRTNSVNQKIDRAAIMYAIDGDTQGDNIHSLSGRLKRFENQFKINLQGIDKACGCNKKGIRFGSMG